MQGEARLAPTSETTIFCLLPSTLKCSVKLLCNMLHFYAIDDQQTPPEDLSTLRFVGFMSRREHHDLTPLWETVAGTHLHLQDEMDTRLKLSDLQDLQGGLLKVYEKKPHLWEHSSFKHFEEVLRVALAEHKGLLVLPHEKKPG